ncbi:MAG: TetR/AcrR family transcriptional regulator [Candidatus Heimdallarchaeota archaeon]|nr:TetR/AcrR family transcriptional regulator [Candidatus Heimdallarchaeota archaeon]
MKQDKRQMILEAAGECFERFGYNKTTLKDIGERVGLNKASLYYYFKSKAEIYITMVTTQFRDQMKIIYADFDKIEGCENKILTYFEKRLDWLYAQSSILTHITQEDLNTFLKYADTIVAQLGMDERIAFRTILSDCMKKGTIRIDDVEKVSNYIFGLVDGIYAQHHPANSMEIITEEEMRNTKHDITTALKIFIKGMQQLY